MYSHARLFLWKREGEDVRERSPPKEISRNQKIAIKTEKKINFNNLYTRFWIFFSIDTGGNGWVGDTKNYELAIFEN